MQGESVTPSFKFGTKPVSLRNSGATCYLNSALQGISACTGFVKKIKDLKEHNKELKQLGIFANMMLKLNRGSETPYEIAKEPIFRNWNKTGQQDSFELMSYIVNEVFSEIRSKLITTEEIDKSIGKWINVNLPLRIRIKYQLRCDCGKVESSPTQCDLALHVPIEPNAELQSLVDSFFQTSAIDSYECSKEGCRDRPAQRTAKLVGDPPETVCIHLQRNHWNVNSRKMRKINSDVKFGESLELKPEYFCDKDPNFKAVKYQLRSVINHSGSIFFGHYVCQKKFNDGWFQANDSSIYSTDLKSVLKKEAYILFYERSSSEDRGGSQREDRHSSSGSADREDRHSSSGSAAERKGIDRFHGGSDHENSGRSTKL